MSMELQEEPTPYRASRGEEDVWVEASMKALRGMDWDAYEKTMDERLQRAVLACARGERGIPLEEAMQRLKTQAAVRHAARTR
jgi:hypothetical protein